MNSSSHSGRSSPLPPCHVLPFGRRIAYSVGHILNDLCASMWFTYLLIFLQSVLKFNTKIAGGLFIWGQVMDGIATPIVGYESDRRNTCCKYGRRKSWHLFGTICVAVTFPFIFMTCISCENSDEIPKFAYYAMFIAIFQVGWASTQVSHLSLIPDLSPISSERVELSALRYAMTVLSNIFAFSILWLFLGINDNSESHITAKDAPIFKHVALILVGVGVLFSVLFHIFVKEKPIPSFAAADPLIINDQDFDDRPHLRWKDWFRQPQFYMVAFLYMSTRLYINVTQVYMPLYIQDSLSLHKSNIAIIPLVMYISSFISSFLMKYLNVTIGNKGTYFIGCVIALCTCVWMFVGDETSDSYRFYEIYAISVLIGVAESTLLILAISFTNDLIDNSISSGAFVFGCMSFVDKLANGVAVMTIQNAHPCQYNCDECKWFYEDVIIFASGGAIVLGLLGLGMLLTQDIGVRHSTTRSLVTANSNGKLSSDDAINRDEVRPLLVDDDDDDGLTVS